MNILIMGKKTKTIKAMVGDVVEFITKNGSHARGVAVAFSGERMLIKPFNSKKSFFKEVDEIRFVHRLATPFLIEQYDNTVTAEIVDTPNPFGIRWTNKGTATCRLDEEFDPVYGALLALARAGGVDYDIDEFGNLTIRIASHS